MRVEVNNMSVVKIEYVRGHEIIDSRGNPTVYCEIMFSDGSTGYASVPSGASTGKFEACELRDNDSRFGGKGVNKAVNNINEAISDEIVGRCVMPQNELDAILLERDGTENKSSLGANAILAVSLAYARALANLHGLPLYRYIGGINGNTMPVPMMNILNGGAHAANNIDIQEFMIMPTGAECIHESVRIGCDIYKMLGELLKNKNLSCGVGDEGGFAPMLSSDEEAIELILEATEKAGYSNKVKLALDAATSEWYKDGKYYLPKRKKEMTSDELISYWEKLSDKYPICSLEDGLSEDDWEGWKKLTEKLGNRMKLVGDDLFVTNSERLKEGISKKCGNSILIKLNQIGTLTETINTVNMAAKNGYSSIISHRSGETEDSFIADLAVGLNAGMIKTGAPQRSDRCAKYNRLLLIESEIYNILL